MTMEEENNTTVEDIPANGIPFQFILLLIVELPALFCTIILFIYLSYSWQTLIKQALRNHVLLILVILSLLYMTLDLPFSINSYRLGFDQPRDKSFCLWWYFLDYTLIIASIFLTAIASVQRHILIFHAHWFYSKRVKYLLHFLPIFLCLIYPILFYLSTIIFYPCEQSDDNESLYCSQPCYTDSFALFNFDWIINTALPLLTIMFANFTLIIRVIRSMRKIRRRRQSLTWKRQRKLTLQLLSLSYIYVLGWAPSTIVSIIQSFAQPNLLEDIPQLEYCDFLTFFVCPLQSLICVLSLPELRKSVKRLFRRSVIARIRDIV